MDELSFQNKVNVAFSKGFTNTNKKELEAIQANKIVALEDVTKEKINNKDEMIMD